MNIPTILVIALALAMDAFAVSLSTGVTMCKMHLRHAIRMAFAFGFFQAAMPIAGWSLGNVASSYVKAFDHWLSFILLAAIGGKMIFDSLKHEDVEDEGAADPHNVYVLFTLAIATSIDAAAVGISLSFLNVKIVQPSIIIGVVTCILSFIGTLLGCKIGNIFGKKIEVFAGIVLIIIGAKILIEHTLLS